MKMKTFKVVIAGGRDFDDYDLLRDKCTKLLTNKSNIVVVSGTANGADKLGEVFGAYNRYEIKRFKADWDNIDTTPCLVRYNRSGKPYNALAGNIRNKEMGEFADAGIVFWDGKSKGSADMIKILEKLGKPVKVIKY